MLVGLMACYLPSALPEPVRSASEADWNPIEANKRGVVACRIAGLSQVCFHAA